MAWELSKLEPEYSVVSLVAMKAFPLDMGLFYTLNNQKYEMYDKMFDCCFFQRSLMKWMDFIWKMKKNKQRNLPEDCKGQRPEH